MKTPFSDVAVTLRRKVVTFSVRFCAPKSVRRLSPAPRTAVEAAVFGLGAAGLAVAGQVALAAAFVVIAAVNWALLFAWSQDP